LIHRLEEILSNIYDFHVCYLPLFPMQVHFKLKDNTIHRLVLSLSLLLNKTTSTYGAISSSSFWHTPAVNGSEKNMNQCKPATQHIHEAEVKSGYYQTQHFKGISQQAAIKQPVSPLRPGENSYRSWHHACFPLNERFSALSKRMIFLITWFPDLQRTPLTLISFRLVMLLQEIGIVMMALRCFNLVSSTKIFEAFPIFLLMKGFRYILAPFSTCFVLWEMLFCKAVLGRSNISSLV